jgi:hypothetical protein
MLAMLGLSVTMASAAMADSWSLSPFPPKVLPVLVNVNASGKVTEASPAMELPPAFDRLMRENLDEMITGPAHRHGRAVSSQFVLNLYLRAIPRKDGEYDVSFAYASTNPVPSGRWHWVSLDGRRLALAADGSSAPRFFHPRSQYPSDRGAHFRNMPQRLPAMSNAPAPASAPAPAPVTPPRSGH